VKLAEKVTYVAELVAFIYDRTDSALAALALLRAADAALIRRTDSDSIDTRILRLNEKALVEFFAIRVARMLDPAEQGNACLPEVFDSLADSDIRNAVLRRYGSTAPAQREVHLATAFKLWERVRGDARRDKLRRLRSHALAHNLIHRTYQDWQEGLGLPTPALVEYAEECFAVVGELAWACLGANELDKVRTEGQQAAERIWGRLS